MTDHLDPGGYHVKFFANRFADDRECGAIVLTVAGLFRQFMNHLNPWEFRGQCHPATPLTTFRRRSGVSFINGIVVRCVGITIFLINRHFGLVNKQVFLLHLILLSGRAEPMLQGQPELFIQRLLGGFPLGFFFSINAKSRAFSASAAASLRSSWVIVVEEEAAFFMGPCLPKPSMK
jgi:hypothetical protein